MYVALSYLSYLWDLGFEEAKRWGDALKSPFGGGNANHKRGTGRF